MVIADSSVAAFYEKLAPSWSANDGAEFSDFFTHDGSLVNPFGERADGRNALLASGAQVCDPPVSSQGRPTVGRTMRAG